MNARRWKFQSCRQFLLSKMVGRGIVGCGVGIRYPAVSRTVISSAVMDEGFSPNITPSAFWSDLEL